MRRACRVPPALAVVASILARERALFLPANIAHLWDGASVRMAPPAGEEGEQAPLVGFLFGNVDENNRVEADYLDEVGQAPT